MPAIQAVASAHPGRADKACPVVLTQGLRVEPRQFRRDGDRLQGVALLVGHVLRHGDVHGDQKIAVLSVFSPNTLTAHSENSTRGRSRGDLQCHGVATRCGNGDLAPECSLAEGDRCRQRDVVAFASEDRVVIHVHDDEEVSDRPAALSGTTLALQSDSRAVLHACGNAGVHRSRADSTPRSPARDAGIVDEEASTATRRARLGESPRLRTSPVTYRARCIATQAKRDGHPIECIVEGESQFALEVLSAPRLTIAPSTPSVEQSTEEVAESTTAVTEEILNVDVVLAAPETSGAAGTAKASTGESSSGKEGTGFVIFLALRRVRQNVVGLRDIFEAGLGCGVSGVFIRMVLASEGSVLLL